MSERPLDERIERLLANEAMWVEPPRQLEESILAEVTPPSRRVLPWLGVAAAAAALIVALVAVTRPDTPDWTVALAAPEGTGIVGEVSGFNESTGTRLLLTVENLEPAAEGTFYEVWWVDLESGGAVSSGGFLEADTIPMWMGVRRGEFPKMLITLERSDGDPGRSDTVIAWSDD